MTGRRREPMTLADHQALATGLARIRDELLDIERWLDGRQLTRERRAMRSLITAQKKLDQARSDFDGVLFDQYSEGQGATPDIYYPRGAGSLAARSRRTASRPTSPGSTPSARSRAWPR